MANSRGTTGQARAATASQADATARVHGVATPGVPSGWQEYPPPPLPARYEVRESDEGRFLHCDEAPRLRVSIDRKHSFSDAEAVDLGKRVILLDGAGRFGPLIDNSRHLYNLDHHEDCQRAFTLATCEQALLLVHSGLELDEGDWTVYANEPDLDTVLALWCLLNYRRIPELGVEARDILLPLIRLEGAIDANGTELARHCGLPSDVFDEAKARLDTLHAKEQSIKGIGEWLTTDLHEFTVDMLQQMDELIYSSSDFADYTRVEEIYGHVEIAKRRVAVICRDRAGIYEVEQHLKQRWGEQLVLIALEKEPHHYTLRRPVPLADIDLEKAYEKLNLLDPAVDGRPPGKQWGGSDNIGGSPRPTGTLLAPREILRVLRLAYQKPKPLNDLRNIADATATAVGLCFAGVAAGLAWPINPDWRPPALTFGSAHLASLAAVLVAGGWLLSRRGSERRLWLYGWRRPAGLSWLGLAPVVLACTLPLRAWVPHDLVFEPLSLGMTLASLAALALGLEVVFRGFIHGLLILDGPIQMVRGPWFVSRATTVASVLYAAAAVALTAPWILVSPFPLLSAPQEIAVIAVAGVLAGLALGLMRERTSSIWPGVGVQIVALVVTAAFWMIWSG